MVKKLNRDMPFGTISEVYHGAKYEQGDNFYDPAGNFVFALGKDGEHVKTPSKPPKKEAPVIVDEDEDDEDDEVVVVKKPESDIDLVAWAKGEKSIPWFQVKKEAKALYPDETFNKADELKDFLADEGLL